MIKYNFRYRGPFEYDKYILNIMQFANSAKNFQTKINNKELKNLREQESKLDELINSFSGADNFLNQLLGLRIRLGKEEITSDD